MVPKSKAAAISASADALDDDFELDNDLIAYESEDELESAGARENSSNSGKRKNPKAGPSQSKPRVLKPISDEEDEFALDDEDLELGVADEEGSSDEELQEDEYGLPVGRSSKRARLSEDDEGATKSASAAATKGPSNQTPATAEEKKRKRKEKQKAAKKQKMQAIDEAEAEAETSFIAIQPPALQADYMAEMQSQAMPKMSSMEAEDFHIAESYLMDTTSYEDRKSFKDFVKQVTQYKDSDLKKEALAGAGSPKVVVISGAALRVTDVVRDLRDLAGKGGEVAKLFAKHFKLAEHCTYCEKTKFAIGAGTPDRILKLIEADALKLDALTHLVLDTKKDAKKRNLLDIPESRTAVFKLLANGKVNDRLKAGSLKLVMY